MSASHNDSDSYSSAPVACVSLDQPVTPVLGPHWVQAANVAPTKRKHIQQSVKAFREGSGLCRSHIAFPNDLKGRMVGHEVV